MSDSHLVALAILVWGTLAASVGTVLWLAYHAPAGRGPASGKP
jgi:hypothetical protein